MSRSLFKGPFPFSNPNASQKPIKKNSRSNYITKTSRQNIILPQDISKTFSIHNGRKWVRTTVIEDMLGYKFGSFVFSRSLYRYTKKKK